MVAEFCHSEKLTGFGKETTWAACGDVHVGTADAGL